MNALKRVRNIRSGDKLSANLLESPISTFRELDPELSVKEPKPIDVIFVHGLSSKRTSAIRKQLKTWLREVRKSVGCRVWRYGFDGKELLAEGRQRLMLLAGRLLKEVQEMDTKPDIEDGKRKLVFIGYGVAGWIIQEALAWYSTTSTQTARETAMVILMNLEPVKNKDALKTYLERFPELHPGKGNVNLEFAIVEIIQENFKHLLESKFGPKERRVEVNLQNDSVLRRETSDTHHTTDSTSSSNTDTTNSSNESGTATATAPVVEQKPPWQIKPKDKTDEYVKSLLLESLTVEKPSVDKALEISGQPEYQAVAPTYGSHKATDFPPPRRVGTVLTAAKSPNFFHHQRNAPPTPPPEPTENPLSGAVLPRQQTIVVDSQAVDHATKMLKRTGSTAPSLTTPEVYIDSKPVGTTTAEEISALTESGSDPAGRETSLVPVGSSRQSSKPSPKTREEGFQLLRLAFLYKESGELRKSRSLYESLLKEDALKAGADIIKTQIAIIKIYEGDAKEAQKDFSELEPKADASYEVAPQKAWEIKRWLAISFDMQGLYEKGREKLMSISEKITSFQQAQRISDIGLLTKSTLALVLGHLGRYEEALRRSNEVLKLAFQAVERTKEEARKLNEGKGDPAPVTRQRGVLGYIQFDQAKILTYVGRIAEAEIRNDEALENIQRNVGTKHVSTLDCWSLKARHLASSCKLPEAEEQCQKTLRVMRKEIGKEHPSTLKTLGVLVYVYRLQARLTEALDTAIYLLESCKASKAFGEDHPETIYSMWQLAEVYLARGDISNALHLQDQVVKLGDKVFGRVHPTVVNYRACLARVYCNRGSWTSSAGLCYDVLDNYVSILSDAFQDRHGKGSKQENQKQKEAHEKGESKSVIQRALDRAREIFILDNDDFETLNLSLASTIQCLGVTERERQHGDLGIAQELQTKAHDYIKSKLGNSHADTLSSKWDLVVTKLRRGQKDAIQDMVDVTASRRKVLGEDHPDTLAARQLLSVTKFNESGDMTQLAEQEDVLRLCAHLLGEEHPTTNAARIDLSNAYHLIRKLQEAEKLRLTALAVQIKTLPSPELTGAAKLTYEQALSTLGVEQANPIDAESSNAEAADEEQDDSPPQYCHPQVIASLAALALIYVDLAQSADEAALASMQTAFVDPESEKSHNLLISIFNTKAIAAQHAVVEQQCLIARESKLPKDSPARKRKSELLAQLRKLRQEENSVKSESDKILKIIKNEEGKLKDLISAQKESRGEVSFKNVDEIDEEITRLEKQVKSDTMKLVDQKKVLAEISSLRRHRKVFSTSEGQIYEKTARLKDLLVQSHQLSNSRNNILAELETIKAEEEKALTNIDACPEALDSMNTLGLIYQAAGDQQRAIATYKSVLRLADESSILHFTSQSNLGTLLFNERLYEEAEEVQTKAYEKRKSFGEAVVGPKEYVIAVFNLALTKKELGKDGKARELMDQAYQSSKDAFGATDPMTGQIYDTWKEWEDEMKWDM